MLCGCLEIVHRPQLFATFFGHICGKFLISTFFYNVRPLWNKNSWHLCTACQSCHYQLSRFLPISRLRGLPTNFKFQISCFPEGLLCCRLANESTRSNRWDWYILWILVSYLLILKLSKKTQFDFGKMHRLLIYF